MLTSLKILGISGSLRRNSYNTALLRAAAQLTPPEVRLEIADIGEIPLYNVELQEMGDPPAVREFKDHISTADALLIATPEYNHSIPGVLKNTLDWASRPRKNSPFRNKPVAIIGAGGMHGSLRAQLHLREIVAALGTQPLNRPELMVPRAWEHFDSEGRLTNPEIERRLAAVVQALTEWTRILKEDTKVLV